jgi:hypothetical protein
MNVPDQSQVETAILQVLAAVQDMGGHAVQQITVATIPLKELPGFDSQTGVETTTLLAARLGCKISPKGKGANLFVSDDGRRLLSVNEIAGRMVEILSVK